MPVTWFLWLLLSVINRPGRLSVKGTPLPLPPPPHTLKQGAVSWGKDGGWGYLGHSEKLFDQVLLAIHTASHNSVRGDPGQVALLVFVHRPAGVVGAEQLILVPVSLLWQGL